MAIKSIIEMKAKPGRRDELLSTLEKMSAADAPGFITAEHYRHVEDEDTIIGIYDWRSNEERVAWSQSLDPATRQRLTDALATPMRILLAEPVEKGTAASRPPVEATDGRTAATSPRGSADAGPARPHGPRVRPALRGGWSDLAGYRFCEMAG